MQAGDTSQGRWRLGHRPALDGLRGLAIGLVLLAHGGVPDFPQGGKTGVCLFFVLSGFLITTLLLEEHERRGSISLRGFYARRVRRLAPAFLFSTAVVCVLGWVARGIGFLSVRDVVLAVCYIGNWFPALMNVPKPAPLGGLSGTWSLAIEEQFYAVWPLLLIVAMRWRGTRAAAWLAAAGVAASLVVRVALLVTGATGFRVYYGTDTNAAALLAGALLAALLHRGVTTGRAQLVAAGIGVAGLVAACCYTGASWSFMQPSAVLASLVLLWSLARSSAPGPAWFCWRWLTWLGTRSYAIYLWNCVIAVAVFYWPAPWPIKLMVVAVPSLLMAELSWRCIESPFLRSRSRQDAEPERVVAGRGRSDVAAPV